MVRASRASPTAQSTRGALLAKTVADYPGRQRDKGVRPLLRGLADDSDCNWYSSSGLGACRTTLSSRAPGGAHMGGCSTRFVADDPWNPRRQLVRKLW
eukprot:CAMPEP_0171256174 /NCGR_PEP_ID=MMETSP0790-20130122/53164_1 /TAXON_ID=2925 /ORGANISM="Alexandrium catenella, Strain OF101" /LENGTH=97 /DNA_ID=CAMNT_0011724185 /DNA_START=21 /DNA_END=315 /DNA_ORIENTATION=+